MEISAIGTTREAGLRTIVVALDADVESLRALDWVQHEFYKPGDVLHMVHVCRCMSSPLEVFHGDTPILSYLHSDCNNGYIVLPERLLATDIASPY